MMDSGGDESLFILYDVKLSGTMRRGKRTEKHERPRRERSEIGTDGGRNRGLRADGSVCGTGFGTVVLLLFTLHRTVKREAHGQVDRPLSQINCRIESGERKSNYFGVSDLRIFLLFN